MINKKSRARTQVIKPGIKPFDRMFRRKKYQVPSAVALRKASGKARNFTALCSYFRVSSPTMYTWLRVRGVPSPEKMYVEGSR